MQRVAIDSCALGSFLRQRAHVLPLESSCSESISICFRGTWSSFLDSSMTSTVARLLSVFSHHPTKKQRHWVYILSNIVKPALGWNQPRWAHYRPYSVVTQPKCANIAGHDCRAQDPAIFSQPHLPHICLYQAFQRRPRGSVTPLPIHQTNKRSPQREPLR